MTYSWPLALPVGPRFAEVDFSNNICMYDHGQSIAAKDQLDSIYGLEGAFRTATTYTPGTNDSNVHR